MTKQIKQAEQKVTKALNVFTQAIKEVEQAQELIKASIHQDSMYIIAHENSIKSAKQKIEDLTKDKEVKGQQFKANEELLAKLKEFKA